MGRPLVHLQGGDGPGAANPLKPVPRKGNPSFAPRVRTFWETLADIPGGADTLRPMKTLLFFACLGLSIGGGHLWAIAINFHLPVILSVAGAIATVSGGLLAGLVAAADEVEG